MSSKSIFALAKFHSDPWFSYILKCYLVLLWQGFQNQIIIKFLWPPAFGVLQMGPWGTLNGDIKLIRFIWYVKLQGKCCQMNNTLISYIELSKLVNMVVIFIVSISKDYWFKFAFSRCKKKKKQLLLQLIMTCNK